MSGGSICFDPVADRYDATRGGDARARHIAASLAPWLGQGETVLEVGVGTGSVAAGLRELGTPVVGVDLSLAMLAHARTRLGSVVSAGDGHSLPVRSSAVSAGYLVWVLHLVADIDAVLAECARVLRPGGRLLVIVASAPDPDEITAAEGDVHIRLRPKRDAPDTVAAAAVTAGLRVVTVTETPAQTWEQSPADAVERFERRDLSALWHLDDERWAAEVEPVIERLRALPEPDRMRRRRSRSPLIVLERPRKQV